MNAELKFHSIVRPKKPKYEHGKVHKAFDNKLRQNFTAEGVGFPTKDQIYHAASTPCNLGIKQGIDL